MKPYVQTRQGAEGNCFETCLMSIMEVPYDESLDFGKEANWFKNAKEYVKRFGYDLLFVDLNKEYLKNNPGWWPLSNDTYCIVCGETTRGTLHAVIYKDNQLVHDPHPSNGGLKIIDAICVLVPQDPAKVLRITSKWI